MVQDFASHSVASNEQFDSFYSLLSHVAQKLFRNLIGVSACPNKYLLHRNFEHTSRSTFGVKRTELNMAEIYRFKETLTLS